MYKNDQRFRQPRNRYNPNEHSIFYTEDNIPVNTLYVSYGMYQLEDESLVRKQFEQFGQINEIIIVSTRPNRFCFVHFENCEDAAKVLRCNQRFKHVARISSADSWHQDGYKSKKEPYRNMNVSEESSSSSSGVQKAQSTTETVVNEGPPPPNSLLYLNDDCLLQIMKHLDIFELIGLRKVCPRLDGVVRIMFSRYRKFDFSKDVEKTPFLTLMETRMILANLGPHMTCLKMNSSRFTSTNIRLLNLVPKYCHNLKELHMDGFVLSLKIYREFDFLFQTLESLSLKNCHVTDTIEKHLDAAINLKSLDLSCNSEVTGRCLKGLKNIEHLNLESCVNVQPHNFVTFCEKNQKLLYLNIARCNKLNLESLGSIVYNFKDLQHIVLNSRYLQIDNQDYTLLSKLEKLKKAEILFTQHVSIDHQIVALGNIESLEYLDISNAQFTCIKFKDFADFKNLKELKLNYKENLTDEELIQVAKLGKFTDLHVAGCHGISDEAAIQVIKLNSQLKFFDVSCTSVSEKLVFGCLDILKSSKRRLKLKIGDTNICTEILNNALIKGSQDLIDLSFDYTEGAVYDYEDSDDDDDDDDTDFEFDDDDDDLDLDMDMWNSDYDQDFDLAGCNGILYDSDDSGPMLYPINMIIFKH